MYINLKAKHASIRRACIHTNKHTALEFQKCFILMANLFVMSVGACFQDVETQDAGHFDTFA